MTAGFLSSEYTAIFDIVDNEAGGMKILNKAADLDDFFIKMFGKHVAYNDG